jgi:hypothetical protein
MPNPIVREWFTGFPVAVAGSYKFALHTPAVAAGCMTRFCQACVGSTECPALLTYPRSADNTAWRFLVGVWIDDRYFHGFHPNTLIPALLAILAQLVAPWEP